MTRKEVLKRVDAKILKCEEYLSSPKPEPGGLWWPLSPFDNEEAIKAWKKELAFYTSIRSLIVGK